MGGVRRMVVSPPVPNSRYWDGDCGYGVGCDCDRRGVVVVVVVVVAGGNAQRELERPVGDAAVVATDQAGGTGTGANAAGLVDAYQGPVAGSGDQRGGGQERHRVVGSR
mmetsp:Transcript_3667/g.6781  ORF Transcript_3667/g.6781 Transcript_3667/m.6781 type:complete len:109 (-) Transcript_3667:99-425(-)